MGGEIDCGADGADERDCEIVHDERNRSRPGRLRVPEQHEVVGDVKRVDDRERQYPRSQIPETVGISEEYDAENWTDNVKSRDGLEFVPEDHEAAYRRIVGELQRLGEVGEREQYKQRRDHGEEYATRRSSVFISHARETNRARIQIQATKRKRPKHQRSGRSLFPSPEGRGVRGEAF